MSTPFDEKAVDELYSLGVKRLKIAGFEATDPRIVKYAAGTQLPLIITAGIGVDLATIQKIIEWVAEKNPNPDITFLHGNNAYPTPYEDACLGQIKRIKNMNYTHKIKVGISDHTRGILIPPIAVALGATTVEKHYTFSRLLPGADHGEHALEPDELNEMIKNIRNVENSMRSKSAGLSESEQQFKYARRSVVATSAINQGEALTLENITTKRPSLSGAISADMFYDVLGQKIKKNIKADEVLMLEHLQ